MYFLFQEAADRERDEAVAVFAAIKFWKKDIYTSSGEKRLFDLLR